MWVSFVLYVVQIALLYKHVMAYKLAAMTKAKHPSFTPTPEASKACFIMSWDHVEKALLVAL